MTPTLTALLGFAGWFVFLTLALGIYRISLVFSGQRAANSFKTDGSDTPGFPQRLTRARDNCFETLAVFAAIAFVASASGKLAVTDGLAMWVLYARVAQSIAHLVSTSAPVVIVRANFFFLQVLIYAWWVIQLAR